MLLDQLRELKQQEPRKDQQCTTGGVCDSAAATVLSEEEELWEDEDTPARVPPARVPPACAMGSPGSAPPHRSCLLAVPPNAATLPVRAPAVSAVAPRDARSTLATHPSTGAPLAALSRETADDPDQLSSCGSAHRARTVLQSHSLQAQLPSPFKRVEPDTNAGSCTLSSSSAKLSLPTPHLRPPSLAGTSA